VMVYAIGFEGASISGAVKNIAKRSGGRATELKGSRRSVSRARGGRR
jgi:hypothetical protein